nr:hypothetical protein [Klebsormidium sp. TAA2-JRJ3pt]
MLYKNANHLDLNEISFFFFYKKEFFIYSYFKPFFRQKSLLIFRICFKAFNNWLYAFGVISFCTIVGSLQPPRMIWYQHNSSSLAVLSSQFQHQPVNGVGNRKTSNSYQHFVSVKPEVSLLENKYKQREIQFPTIYKKELFGYDPVCEKIHKIPHKRGKNHLPATAFYELPIFDPTASRQDIVLQNTRGLRWESSSNIKKRLFRKKPALDVLNAGNETIASHLNFEKVWEFFWESVIVNKNTWESNSLMHAIESWKNEIQDPLLKSSYLDYVLTYKKHNSYTHRVNCIALLLATIVNHPNLPREKKYNEFSIEEQSLVNQGNSLMRLADSETFKRIEELKDQSALYKASTDIFFFFKERTMQVNEWNRYIDFQAMKSNQNSQKQENESSQNSWAEIKLYNERHSELEEYLISEYIPRASDSICKDMKFLHEDFSFYKKYDSFDIWREGASEFYEFQTNQQVHILKKFKSISSLPPKEYKKELDELKNNIPLPSLLEQYQKLNPLCRSFDDALIERNALLLRKQKKE